MLKRRTPLKRVSDKRRKQMREYSAARAKFLDENPMCQACGKRRSSQIHHKAGRFGLRLLQQDQWLAVCSRCHSEVHASKALAIAKGFSRPT